MFDLIKEVIDNIPNWAYYPPIGDLKFPIGDNITNWGLGIYESGNAESENKSPIPNWIKYHQFGI